MPLELFNRAERARLDSFPSLVSSEDLQRDYHLTRKDKAVIARQRRPTNRLGFALQLCTLRHLGFIPDDLLGPPPEVLHFVADQLDVTPGELSRYQRQATQNDHLREVMAHLGFRRAAPLDDAALESWLTQRALEHDRPLLLFNAACTFLKRRRVIRPGITALERLISEARTRAHRLTYEALEPLLTSEVKGVLEEVLAIPEGYTTSRLAWLQRSPTDANVTQIKEVLGKLDFLQCAGVGSWDVSPVNPNRLKWLAGVGARSRRQNLLRTDEVKRTCVLVAFLHQSLYSYTDDAVQMFDTRVWELYTLARSDFERDRRRARGAINENLALLQNLGNLLLDEATPDDRLREAAFSHIARDKLSERLSTNETLLRPERDAHLDYFRARFNSVRNVAKPFLATLTFKSWGEDGGLLEALGFVKELHTGKRRRIPNAAPTAFIPELWQAYLWTEGGIERHYYELAAVWVLRERLRSGDVYVETSKRFMPVETYLIPRTEWPKVRQTVSELTSTPLSADVRLEVRLGELRQLAGEVEVLVQDKEQRLSAGAGRLQLGSDASDDQDPEVERLSANIGAGLAATSITDVLLEVDRETGFSQGFGYLGVGQSDVREALLHLYACLLAQGCNLGFTHMAQSAGLSSYQLRRFSTWFVNEASLESANTALVNAHHALPYSQVWGGGMLSSSDGQRFPMTTKGKTPKARHNPRYFGLNKGVTFYTWTSDQFSQYGSQAIPSTVRDASYVLDAILDNETDLDIQEHSTDTAGYTELIFAVFDLLGLRFTPRIRDLKEQTLYRTKGLELGALPNLAPCLTGVLREPLIEAHWDEMLRFVGSLKLGYVTASLVIQKLQAYPRQHPLLKALQAYGRLPKTLHILSGSASRERASRPPGSSTRASRYTNYVPSSPLLSRARSAPRQMSNLPIRWAV